MSIYNKIRLFTTIFSVLEKQIVSHHQDLFCKSTQRTAKNIIKNIDIEITLYKYVDLPICSLLKFRLIISKMVRSVISVA